MVVNILRDCTATAVIVTCQACFVQQTYLWWMYLLLSSLLFGYSVKLLHVSVLDVLCLCPPMCPPVPTTNEKWVGTCLPVPYGLGAYGQA